MIVVSSETELHMNPALKHYTHTVLLNKLIKASKTEPTGMATAFVSALTLRDLKEEILRRLRKRGKGK